MQADGTNVSNFTSQNLEEGLSEEDEQTLKWTAASLYAGGSDTVRPFHKKKCLTQDPIFVHADRQHEHRVLHGYDIASGSTGQISS